MWDELHVAIGWWILLLLHWATKPYRCIQGDCRQYKLYNKRNRSSPTRPTRELTFIKICRKLLDANLSEDRISPLDPLHLCQTDEQLGRWSWLKVERKDPSGTSRTVHSMRHSCGGLTFSAHPLRTLLGEILLQLDALLTFLLSCCAFTPRKIGSL